ncbi:MAG: hypothetical protein JEZ14_19720 [Marinilabiliaceae bacterium]|nr:hypothetical protein [Marinilabiliaceae bacterium]
MSESSASFPDGKWSSRGNEPFYARHEIRANMRMAMMESDKKFNDAWYISQFAQFDKTRKLTWFSPFSIFEYGTEVMLDGGYTRFLKN